MPLPLFNFQGTLSVNDVENQSKCDISEGSSDNGEEIKELSSSSTTCDGEFFGHSPLYS